jgi:hypothetical protein
MPESGSVTVWVKVMSEYGCIDSVSTTISTILGFTPIGIQLSSGENSTHQSVCAGVAISDINYTVTGADDVTFAGIPEGIGLTRIWSNDQITIGGLSTVAGTYNYTITATGACNSANVTGNVVVNASPEINPSQPADQSTCAGTPVTLALPEQSGITYTWYDSGDSLLAIGNSYSTDTGGSYYAVASNISGCTTSSRTATVICHAKPLIAEIAAVSICYNTKATLACSITDGITGAMTYTWKIGGATTTTTVNSFTTGSLTTTTTYTVSATNGHGCSSTSTANTITTFNPAIPTTPMTNGNKCSGTGITFSAAIPSGAIGLNWAGNVSGNGASITSGTAAGSYTVRARSYNITSSGVTCYSSYTNNVTGVIYASPAIPSLSQNGPKCVGNGAITFTTSGGSGVYQWSGAFSGAGATKTTSTVANTYTAAVRSSQTYTGMTCYSSYTNNVSGIIYANPLTPGLSQNGPKCAGTAITFTASGGSGAYDWSGTFSGSGKTKTTATTAGSYTAAVRSSQTHTGVTCYSGYTNNVTGIINTPTSTHGTAPNSCGCASTLTNCSGICLRACNDFTSCPGFTKISSGQGSNAWPAADNHCRTAVIDGTTGWRLPTSSELRCICQNKASVPGGGMGASGFYWSSSLGCSSEGKQYVGVNFANTTCLGYCISTWSYVPHLIRCVK